MDNTTDMEHFCGGPFKVFYVEHSPEYNSSQPRISECFQLTVLVWVPAIFVWFFTPAFIYTLFKSRHLRLPWSLLNAAKLLVAILLTAVTASLLGVNTHLLQTEQPRTLAPVHVVYPVLLCLCMAHLLVFYWFCILRGQLTSGFLFNGLALFAVCGFPQFVATCETLHSEGAAAPHKESLALYMVYYLLLLMELVLQCFADKPNPYDGVSKKVSDTNIPCPETSSSFLNRLTFWWFTSLAMKGWRRPLESKDLWTLNAEDQSEQQVPRWEKRWTPKIVSYNKKLRTVHEHEALNSSNAEYKHKNGEEDEVVVVNNLTPLTGKKKGKAKGPSQPSIVWALFKTYKHIIIPCICYKFMADGLQFANPLILQLLIAFVKERREEGSELSIWYGLSYTVLMLMVSILYTLLLHQYFHLSFRLGMHVKTVLVSAVFKKSLRLSNAARRKSTVGEIVNLMSVDVQRFVDVAQYINLLWSTPFQIVISLYMLWQLLGPAVLAGVAVIILLIPINAIVGTIQRKYQFAQMKLKDSRIKLTTEILNGIKVLKLYAWEPSFAQQITGVRDQELVILKKYAYLSSVTTFVFYCAPFLISALAFAAYVLSSSDNLLTPEVAFVSLSLFNIMRFPMMMLPMMITFLIQASVSNKRLKDFLTAEEINPSFVSHESGTEFPVELKNGVFAWEAAASPSSNGDSNATASIPTSPQSATLTNINLQVPQGALVAVVGTVGAGKTSLLNAILGEMEVLSGSVNVTGSLAYVPQQAWIQNLTLRDNITFGSAVSQRRYDQVVDACALRPDIDMLPGGDMTEIGEKGINLSGGQKQRISLARAVYHTADTYLLDDPLSAVDAHVGKHIFEHVIGPCGILKSKTRILVTHHLSYLKHVDKVVVIENGRVEQVGTYAELLASGGAFAEFIKTYLQNQESTEEDEEEIEELLTCLGAVDPLAKERLQTQISVERQRSESPEKRSRKRTVSRTSTDTGTGTPRTPLSPASPMSPGEDPSKTPSSKTTGTAVQKLIEIEKSETGRVNWDVYKAYMHAVGYLTSALIVIVYTVGSAFSVGSNLWLARWSDENANKSMQESASDTGENLGIYTVFGMGQAVFVLIGSVIMAKYMVHASGLMHGRLLYNLMRSPMSFFDVTPLGRIINRCGKDIDTIDSILPTTIRSWIACVLNVLATIVIIIISTPIFAAVIVPIGVLYYFVQRFYVATSRQLKRIESVSRSPIYSQFQEVIQGASSIRAYNQQERFMSDSERRVDINNMAYYPNLVSNRWLAVRLEFVGTLIVCFAALFAVLAEDMTAGMAGLSISYALSVTQTLNWAVRMTSDLETNIVSVERVKEYSETPTEAEWENEHKPPRNWPSKGAVVFHSYATRYRPGLDLVLKNVSAHILPSEKIGIVGRTGAGKSSLTLALFRLIEPADGTILIDGLDTSKIGLHDLRRRLTIIPQDPVVFSGTLRANLDPFAECSDAELWRSLELVSLKPFVSELPDQLEYEVAEGGENLSVGQRQLICLSRAILRHTQVLVFDEATSGVDPETDELLQRTIREQFAERTILTIAHRLNTIMDNTRIMVLDRGQIAEFDTPTNLLANKQSIFYGMAKDAKIVS